MTPRIVLAKYVSDLSRMEPKNIGVFVWSRGQFCAKFLSEAEATFVNESKTYTRWTEYWSELIAEEALRPARGKPILKSDPACIEALISTQDGNYLLVDVGELLDPIKTKDLPSATSFLFRKLVARPEYEKRQANKTLRQLCDSILDQSGLAARKDFRTKFPISCNLYGRVRTLHATYGFGEEEPIAILQKVVLSEEASVSNAGIILHELANQRDLSADRCGALIQSSAITNRIARDNLEWLKSFCTVIDVDTPGAVSQIVSVVPEHLSI